VLLGLEPGPEPVPARALGLGPVPVRVPGLGQVLVRERERVPAPGLGQALVPHKQPSLRLTTMPAGSVNFSFSSEKLLHLDFGRLKLVYY
jgi:hypothetical protein